MVVETDAETVGQRRKPDPAYRTNTPCVRNQWLLKLNVETVRQRQVFERVSRTNTPCVRAAQVEQHAERPLMERTTAKPETAPQELSVVMLDGGRFECPR